MHPISFLRGAAVGAGLAYFLDPSRGAYRRSLVRDQVIHLTKGFEQFCDVACRDLQNRMQGIAAETQGRFSEGPVPDRILVERVRSQIGRCVSHPRAIEVRADQGQVVLSGPIIEREAAGLIRCVRSVRGVHGVRNELETHSHAGEIPALQGQELAPSGGALLCADHWSPGARLLAGVAGAALIARGVSQRFPASCVNGTIGLALLAGAARDAVGQN
jgi:hypothetical protein